MDLDNYKEEFLSIFSRDVLKRIAAGDETWEQMVPPQVAELIKERGFFGSTQVRAEEGIESRA